MTERTLTIQSNPKEYKNLDRVANILTILSDNGIIYRVEDCYLDYSSKWMWTTIIAHDPKETGMLSSWQAISPRDWKDIVNCNYKEDLLCLVNVLAHKMK